MEVNLQRPRLTLSASDQRSRRFYGVRKVYWLLSGLPKPLTKPFTTLSSGLPLGILARSLFFLFPVAFWGLHYSLEPRFFLLTFIVFLHIYPFLNPCCFCVHNLRGRKQVIFLSITYHNTIFKIFFSNVIWHKATN